jgi:hydrogenase expression/formation protein HypC
MCLGIPGRIVAIVSAADATATIEVGGVRRPVNLSLVQDARPIADWVGEWVLVHVGFAMSVIDAEEAARTLALLQELGELQADMDAQANRDDAESANGADAAAEGDAADGGEHPGTTASEAPR